MPLGRRTSQTDRLSHNKRLMGDTWCAYLRALKAADADPDVCGVNHAHVIGAVPDAQTDLAQRLLH